MDLAQKVAELEKRVAELEGRVQTQHITVMNEFDGKAFTEQLISRLSSAVEQ